MGMGVAVTASATVPTYTLSPTAAPLPGNAASIEGVSLQADPACPAVGSCVAVGSYEDTEGYDWGVIETLSDGTWSAIEAPLPPGGGPGVSLDAVACPSVNSCVAVGSYEQDQGAPDGSSTTEEGLIETLSGGTWSASEAPVPADESTWDPDAVLVALTCAAEGSCVAVGNYESATQDGRGLIESLSDGTWTPTGTGMPPDFQSDSELTAVACASPASCEAVGTYMSTIGPAGKDFSGLIETLAGGTWTARGAPLPGNASTSFSNTHLTLVACPSAGFCEASGWYLDKSGNQDSVFETLTGSTWSPTEFTSGPSNGRRHSAYADTLACPAPGVCVAGGQYEDKDGRAQGLIESLAGGEWTANEAPLPADAAQKRTPAGLLTSVACTSIVSCTAVGSYIDPWGLTHPLIETLIDGTWSDTEAPQPTNESTDPGSDAGLFAIGCDPGGLCVSVGFYVVSGNNVPGLLETPTDAPTPLAVTSVDQHTFVFYLGATCTVTATGSPVPTITEDGNLPQGMHFRQGQGVATIVGHPKLGTAGIYHITIIASNGVQPDATQDFTLTITPPQS
jgi:hypothetical protein